MTKYISLFGATTTDTRVQVVKENQVIIGIGAGASRKRYVVYKVEHTARGYVYHMPLQTSTTRQVHRLLQKQQRCLDWKKRDRSIRKSQTVSGRS